MKKVGILNACTPDDEAEIRTNEFDSFVELFAQVEHDFEFVEYRITEGIFPQSPSECDVFLITGSPKGVYDTDEWIQTLAEFIRQVRAHQRTKMVGICFGHQVLADSLGGKAEKSPKGWGVGMRPLEFVEERPFMSPPLQEGNFYYCHQDQVTQLPEDAELLAGSEFCPNGMFVIDDRVLGLQAHPEFTDEVMSRTLGWFENNVPEGANLAAEAKQVKGKTNNKVMAQWLVNFMRQ